MSKESYMQREQRMLQKLINFRLPRRFMIIGMVIAFGSIAMMFIRAFVLESDSEVLKEALRKTLLIGMLIMSFTKDREEDEMIVQLRMQSYSWAFVTGVIYALVMPYVEFGVSNVVHSGGEEFKNLGDFQVLLFMLLVQLMCYHTLKRHR